MYIEEILEILAIAHRTYAIATMDSCIRYMDADKTLNRLGIIKPVEGDESYALPYDSRGDGTTSGYIIYVDEEVPGSCPHSHELLRHVFSSDELRTLKNTLRKGVRIF